MISRRIAVAVLGLTAIVALPLVVNPRIHLRADAMSNSALAYAVQRHGIPPSDPYLAGQPLSYHWAYNAVAAGIGSLLGVDALSVMVWQGPLALAVLLLGVARLVRGLGGSEGGAILAAVLVVVGLNGWGWCILLSQWIGGGLGVDEALRKGVNAYLFRAVGGIEGSIKEAYDKRLAFFTTKALVSTSFIWALALLPHALSGLLAFLREGRWSHGAIFALATTGVAYSNVVAGAGLMASVTAGLALWACARREGRAAAARRALAAIGLVAASAGLFIPYLAITVSHVAGAEPLATLGWPDGFHLRGFAAVLLPFGVCAGLLGRPRRWTLGQAWLLFLAACFAAAFLFGRVTDGVQTKFLFVAALLLPCYIGSRAAALRPWRRRALWLVAASAVPTTVLGLVAYACAPGTPISNEEAATLGWIRDHSAPDSVVVAHWRSTLVPVLARRDLYVPDHAGFHRAARYDPAVWRRRTAQMERLYGRGEIVPVLEEIARELGRPVVLVTREQLLRVDEPRLRLLHAAGKMRLWALRETGALPAPTR